MQDNSITSLRERLEQLSTEELDRMLQEELDRETPEGALVRTILRVLWEREKDMPREITPGIRMAWEKYREREGETGTRHRRNVFLRLGTVAAVLAVLLLAVPREAAAESLFEKLTRWTDSVVDFFSPEKENRNLLEYEFASENPGLRQVYDAVRELGVTVPVVPGWLPEGYELVECKVHRTSQKNGVSANFRDADSDLMIKIDVYETDVSHKYHRDDTVFDVYEVFNVAHTILRNNDRWVVIWFQENIECSLSVDCPEDTLYEILKSIYVTEGTNETTD
jgi:hypothetical protein